MRTIFAALLAFGTLSVGCVPRPLVIPAKDIPHELASECKTSIYVEAPNGKVETQKVTIPAGWWTASPALVEGP